jgi:HEAT repeat protein
VGPLAGLLGDDAPAISGLAAAALVQIGQHAEEGRQAALAALRDRSEASPSASLYRVLGALGTAEDLPRLRAGLQRPATVQRMAAASAVSSLAQRQQVAGGEVPELVAALSDESWSVRAAAARALVELARAGAGRPGGSRALPAETVEALGRALSDREPAVRAAALEALGATGEVRHAAAIGALARAEEAPAVVVLAALRALDALGQAPADVVARAAGHADPEVVKAAVWAAARLPGEEGEATLRQAAEHVRWDVRQAAARAMLERGDPALRATALLLSARERDPLVARAFAEAAQALAGR